MIQALIPSAVQVIVHSPRPHQNDVKVRHWSLPIWMIGQISPSVGMAFGLEASIVVHKRIADEMNIQEGDIVEFEIVEVGKRFKKAVRVIDGLTSDVTVHGAGSLGIGIQSESFAQEGSCFTFHDGTKLHAPWQSIWAGMKVEAYGGTAVLEFDGASRNNPHGPSGYGYRIISLQDGRDLIRGYGYYDKGSNNEMEYKGLLEGLTWALRLNFEKLRVCGDSKLVILQCTGNYNVRAQNLKVYHDKVMELIRKNEKTKVEFETIPRERNAVADFLANLGIDLKAHATSCNWDAINKHAERSESAL